MSEKPKLLPCGLHRLTKIGGLGLVVKSPETLISPLADCGGARGLSPLSRLVNDDEAITNSQSSQPLSHSRPIADQEQIKKQNRQKISRKTLQNRSKTPIRGEEDWLETLISSLSFAHRHRA
jgi:hypothetical protein